MKFGGIVFSLALTGAAARGLPQVPKALPKGLAVRGGVSQDTITNTAAGLFMASGLFTYISPAKNMEAYGVASITEDQSAYARYLGMIQMASAATLIAGMTKGAEFATAFSMSAAAIALLASIPGFEKLGTPKEPGAIWIVGLGILGKAAREGMIDAGMALKISTAINVLCGVQFYFFPDSAIKMYKVSVPVTTLGKKMFGFAGATLIALAAYLNVAAEKGAAAGLAAFTAVTAITCVKFALVDAKDNGVDPMGPSAWAVICAVISYLSYQNM